MHSIIELIRNWKLTNGKWWNFILNLEKPPHSPMHLEEYWYMVCEEKCQMGGQDYFDLT
jgi:hypothetical protein